MAGLGALAQLDLDHLDLRIAGVLLKALGTETAVVVAAAKVARADFPDQVATVLAVVPRDRAFAGIVRKTAHLGALIERQDGVGRQRAKAHGRDVEDAGLVGLCAGRDRIGRTARLAADPEAKVSIGQAAGLHRMVDPLVALLAHIELGAKGPVVGRALGTLVHQRALRPRKRCGLAVAFDEVLPDFGSYEFEQEAQVADDRVVARDRMVRLPQIGHAAQRQQRGQHEHPASLAPDQQAHQ